MFWQIPNRKRFGRIRSGDTIRRVREKRRREREREREREWEREKRACNVRFGRSEPVCRTEVTSSLVAAGLWYNIIFQNGWA